MQIPPNCFIRSLESSPIAEILILLIFNSSFSPFLSLSLTCRMNNNQTRNDDTNCMNLPYFLCRINLHTRNFIFFSLKSTSFSTFRRLLFGLNYSLVINERIMRVTPNCFFRSLESSHTAEILILLISNSFFSTCLSLSLTYGINYGQTGNNCAMWTAWILLIFSLLLILAMRFSIFVYLETDFFQLLRLITPQ